MTGFEISESRTTDIADIDALYPEAFPDEDLRALVRTLLEDTPEAFSLVATIESELAGHIAFTACKVTGGEAPVALLGPLAVAPARHRCGIGTALLRAGVERLRASGASLVLVLGDPAYYGRLGFDVERAVAPPFALPEAWREAWRSMALDSAALRPSGTLIVPPPWDEPALWML